ncbi:MULTISPECIES: hypothetical protein [unclassified Saccharothrix]
MATAGNPEEVRVGGGHPPLGAIDARRPEHTPDAAELAERLGTTRP